MNTIVVGGGAAGMMAAIIAARNNNKVTLLEKNEKLGKKVYITGKGRCNLTNACDDETFFESVITNPKFLYSAYYGFNSYASMEFFKSIGLNIKTERGNRVFPLSDHSSDVISVLNKELIRLGVKICLNTKVKKILINDNNECVGVLSTIGTLNADKVILATGGKSYPLCGADGDTWKFADELNINTNEAEPSLVPLVTKEDFVKELQGLSLKNVSINLTDWGKKLYSGFGEMLFTHFGVSGPLVLSASSHMRNFGKANYTLSIDLKPALDEKKLDARLLRDFEKYANRDFANSLGDLAGKAMIPVLIELSGIPADTKVNSITREQRHALLMLFKNFPVSISGPRPIDEAIVTSGGVSTKEINPRTMESKLISGLHFAGEVMDLDAYTGGFNLQIAWSTAYTAANSL